MASKKISSLEQSVHELTSTINAVKSKIHNCKEQLDQKHKEIEELNKKQTISEDDLNKLDSLNNNVKSAITELTKIGSDAGGNNISDGKKKKRVKKSKKKSKRRSLRRKY